MAPGAPGMGTQSETCGCCSNFCRKESKKASRVMCGGAMQSVSMSLPGCTTPNLPKTSSRVELQHALKDINRPYLELLRHGLQPPSEPFTPPLGPCEAMAPVGAKGHDLGGALLHSFGLALFHDPLGDDALELLQDLLPLLKTLSSLSREVQLQILPRPWSP